LHIATASPESFLSTCELPGGGTLDARGIYRIISKPMEPQVLEA
jgi:hypothetical protein